MGFIEKLLRRPGVAHIMAANDRYNKRLGPQFSAAVTYFSVLSMVPILMFGFSMLGMTLTVLRPDWLGRVNDAIADTLGGGDVAQSVKGVIKNALENWRGVGLFALLTAAYSGTNWIGNLKRAFRVMWRARFSDASVGKGILTETLENLAIFLGTLLCVAVALGVTVMGTTYAQAVIEWLGLQQVPGIEIMLRVGSIILTFIACWLLFAFLFVVLPGQRTSMRTFMIAVTAGAFLVTILQQVAGILIGLFSGNAAASLFGPVIIVMLLFNLLATIILMTSAWVGTAESWQHDQLKKDVDKAAGLKPKDEVEVADHTHEPAVPDPKPRSRVDQLKQERLAARRPMDQLRVANYTGSGEQIPEAVQVSGEVAVRSTKLAGSVGYGLGAATGIGIGALAATLLRKIFRRG